VCIYIYRYKYRIQWDTPSNPMAVHSFKPPFEAWHLDISSISLWRGWTFPDTCRVARMDGDELVIHWWWEKTGEWKKLTSGLCGLHDYLYIYIHYIYTYHWGWVEANNKSQFLPWCKYELMQFWTKCHVNFRMETAGLWLGLALPFHISRVTSSHPCGCLDSKIIWQRSTDGWSVRGL
jgi:hypothetical protein